MTFGELVTITTWNTQKGSDERRLVTSLTTWALNQDWQLWDLEQTRTWLTKRLSGEKSSKAKMVCQLLIDETMKEWNTELSDEIPQELQDVLANLIR